MGRYSYSSRYKKEDCKSISIFWLNQQGLLTSYRFFEISWTRPNGDKSFVSVFVHLAKPEYLQLSYSMKESGKEGRDFDYKIPLTSTPCYFGGVRYWFVCPLYKEDVYCGRRVGTIYLPPNGSWFGCRHCYDLTYASRLKSGIFKTMRGPSFPEVEELRLKVKRKYYKGKMTRSYKRFYFSQQKLTRDLAVAANYFQRR